MYIMRHLSGRRFTFKGSKVRGRETQRFSEKILPFSAKREGWRFFLKPDGESLFSRKRHGITLPLGGKAFILFGKESCLKTDKTLESKSDFTS